MGGLVSTLLSVASLACQSCTCCFTAGKCGLDFSYVTSSDQMAKGINLALFILYFVCLIYVPENFEAFGYFKNNAWDICDENEVGDDCMKHKAFNAMMRLGVFMGFYFFAHFVLLLVKKDSDIHTKMWPLKLIIIILFGIAFVFTPGHFFESAGIEVIMKLGAYLFLLLQIIILVDFAFEQDHHIDEESTKSCILLATVSLTLYFISILCILYIFINFTSHTFDTTVLFCFITVFMIWLLTGMSLMRHKFVDDTQPQILPAAVVSAYMVYLLYCFANDSKEEEQNFQKLFAYAMTLFSIIYVTVNIVDELNEANDPYDQIEEPLLSSAGAMSRTDETTLSGNGTTVADTTHASTLGGEDAVAPSSMFFYLSLSFSSMNVLMMTTNWGAYSSEEHDILDKGRWGNLVCLCVTFILYTAVLVTPALADLYVK